MGRGRTDERRDERCGGFGLRVGGEKEWGQEKVGERESCQLVRLEPDQRNFAEAQVAAVAYRPPGMPGLLDLLSHEFLRRIVSIYDYNTQLLRMAVRFESDCKGLSPWNSRISIVHVNFQ